MVSLQSSPEATLGDFLRAFSALDLDGMMTFFAPDATAFAPSEHARGRLADRDAIRMMFAGVIARVRATGAAELSLRSEDVQTQTLGAIAVVTLHLPGGHFSRRTFVLRRAGDRWQIVHFHGSNAPVPVTPRE